MTTASRLMVGMLAISHNNREFAPRDNSMIYVAADRWRSAAPGDAESAIVLARLVTGWSKLLAYTAKRDGDFNIFTIPVEGGEERQLTTAPGLDDGPDYSPDGRYIYFNSVRSGLMQIWRMRADGGEQSQLTNDQYNNWFPHPSPDGKKIVFISYLDPIDPATHPANKNVALRLLDPQTGKVRELGRLFGGQGTINVPSWSPDSGRFAFVSYRICCRNSAGLLETTQCLDDGPLLRSGLNGPKVDGQPVVDDAGDDRGRMVAQRGTRSPVDRGRRCETAISTPGSAVSRCRAATDDRGTLDQSSSVDPCR
jgi:dipeptidyl aminopeptidase/acylaminoacyl peptidase